MRYAKEIAKADKETTLPSVRYYPWPKRQQLYQKIANVLKIQLTYGKQPSCTIPDLIKWLKSDFDIEVSAEDVMNEVRIRPKMFLTKDNKIRIWK